MAKPKPTGSVDIFPDSASRLIPKFHSQNVPELGDDYLHENIGKQLVDQIHGETKDLFLNDFVAPFKEIQSRLQKVEEVNKRLKREREGLMHQVDSQKIEIMQLKRANENLLESKSVTDEHIQEQLSITLQENSCLKEATAKMNIDNIQLTQQVSNLQSELNKMKRKMTQLQNQLTDRDRVSSNSSDALESTQQVASKIRQGRMLSELPKDMERQKPSQFFPVINMAEKLSVQLLSQFSKEKKELELQCQQMVDIQKNVDGLALSNTPPSEYSLLGFETSETDDIKAANECLQNLATTKQDLVLINFNLKYLLHVLSRKQGFSSCSGLAIQSEDQLSEDVVADGITSDSLGSRFKPSWKHSNVLSQHISKTDRAVVKSPEFCGRSTVNTSKITSTSTTLAHINHNVEEPSGINSYYKWQRKTQMNSSNSPMQPPVPFWHRNKSSDHNPNTKMIVNNMNFAPGFCRSDSAEGNVGSPPQISALISPDSLSIDNAADPIRQSYNLRGNPKQDKCRTSRSADNDEDRVCPMCQVHFPKCIDQKEFETHVVSHFDVEEFELI